MASLNRGRSEQRVETSAAGRGIVLVEDGLGNRLLGESLAGLEDRGVLGLVVVDVEAEDVLILDRMGDGVGVKLFLEKVRGGSKACFVPLDLPDARVVFEDRGTSEAEELGVREERLDGLVVLAELRAVAIVEDEDHPLVSERPEPLLER